MTPPLSGDSSLETLLREPAPGLPDNGFSTRVLAALPAPKAPRRSRARLRFGAAGALAGIGFAYWRGGSWADATVELRPLSTATTQLVAAFTDPALLLALTVTALSLLFVFRPRAWAARWF